MVFEDNEFDMNKAYRNFKNELQRLMERKFTNADSIRSLEDNSQLALRLWNMPKFDSIEDLQKWLNEEHRYGDDLVIPNNRSKVSKLDKDDDDPWYAVKQLRRRIALKKLEIDKKSRNNNLIIDRRDCIELCELERELDQMIKNIEKGIKNKDE